jgi:hypothetical protein
MFHIKFPKKKTHNSQGNNTWWTFLKNVGPTEKLHILPWSLSLSLSLSLSDSHKRGIKGSLYFKCFFVVFSSIPFSSKPLPLYSPSS